MSWKRIQGPIPPTMRSHPLPATLLVLPLICACQGIAQNPDSDVPSDALLATPRMELSLAALLDTLHLDPVSIRFHVDKSERDFEVHATLPGSGADTLLKSYPCVLGEKPEGDKFHQGDRKTPEGRFTFRSKRVHASWHKFIWVDYPNDESWRRYNERKRQGLIPAGKDIGGEIGIHGVPDGMDHWIDAGTDWTWGCIALRNADVDEIYPYIIAGKTVMEVVP